MADVPHAATSGGIAESSSDPGSGNRFSTASARLIAIAASVMLVTTEAGDTFSFKEMSGWLHEAGFRNPRQMEVSAVSPLVLATKP